MSSLPSCLGWYCVANRRTDRTSHQPISISIFNKQTQQNIQTFPSHFPHCEQSGGFYNDVASGESKKPAWGFSLNMWYFFLHMQWNREILVCLSSKPHLNIVCVLFTYKSCTYKQFTKPSNYTIIIEQSASAWDTKEYLIIVTGFVLSIYSIKGLHAWIYVWSMRPPMHYKIGDRGRGGSGARLWNIKTAAWGRCGSSDTAQYTVHSTHSSVMLQNYQQWHSQQTRQAEYSDVLC